MGARKQPKDCEARAAARAADAQEKAHANLIKAAKGDELKRAEAAVAKGGDLTRADEHGNTLMHIAAMFGALKMIKYLHSQGLRLDLVENEQGRKPVDTARRVGELKSTALLEAIAAGKPTDTILQNQEIDSGGSDEEDQGT